MASEVFHNGQSLGNAATEFKNNSNNIEFNQNGSLLGDPTLSGDYSEPEIIAPVQSSGDGIM